jgi:hypothetical protein
VGAFIRKAIEELTRITKLLEVRAKAQTKHFANTQYVTYQGYIVALKPTVVGDPLTPLFPSDRVPSVVPPVLDVPQGTGYARVLGMGLLHLVREEPKRYELGEIAHVENVMAKERRERKHRRTEKTEEFFSTTTERESENEQDLSSTERFQLRQESTSVINADMSLQSGFNLSASYGPTVTVGASTSASVSASSGLTRNSASDFSREVTERAKNRVLEKVREERSRRITQEIEEINEHGFDNTSGSTHVIGVYRWVDKIVRARLLNYGKRLLLEFVIPEPAAFLLKMILDPNSARKSVTVEEPDGQILLLQASDIVDLPNDAHDYRKLASLYHVTDIEPPPLKFVYQADNISFTETDTAHSQTSSKKITIAPDYSAYKVAFTRSRTRNGSEGITLHTATGSAAGKIEDYKRVWDLGSVAGELPLVVSYFGNRAVSVNINVYCELTPQAFERWQIKTYKALLEGYQNMKSKFDEQVAAESIRQANQGQGFSPERNRAVESAEIKRSVISMLTGQNFDLFGAIQDGDIPSIDLSQAVPEGKYIQFFENSFEWTNMSYIFYPYFWGRKQFWVDKLGLDNTDMNHLAFLQAGAARVVVPVRLDYDPVVIHYLDTGEIWGGADVPDLTGVSAPYLDIATEIREQQGNPTKKPTVEDEWEVRLPTSLVMLQTDAQLPVFIKDN